MSWLCRFCLFVMLVVPLSLCAGCRGCQESVPLAELERKQGGVDRDFADQEKKWKAAELGAEFFVGDGVRTASDGEAILAADDGSKLKLESDTIIRFLDSVPGSRERALEVELGQASVEAGERPLRLRTQVGLATLEPGTTVVIAKSDQGLRYEVVVGLARFSTKDGPVEVTAGEGIAIGIGEAVVERFTLKETTTPADAGADAVSDAELAEAEAGSRQIVARVSGSGARYRDAGEKDSKPLPEGETQLEAGGELDVQSGSSVHLSRGGEQVTVHGKGRYSVATGDALVETSGGKITVDGHVVIHVPGGAIVARRESSAEVTVAGKKGSEVKVQAGEVEVRGDAGSDKVRAGEVGTLEADGKVQVEGRGPGYVDFFVSAGDSFTVHDPKPPTAIGFRFGQVCSKGGILEIGRRGTGKFDDFVRGDTSATVLVSAGAHDYRLRCLGENGVEENAAVRGAITVYRDAGVASLPRAPPATRVDTDGRRYTVLYQNLLPKIVVAWPKAPQASGYTLTVQSGGSSQSVRATKAQHAFRAGSLGEGTHHLVFEGGGKRSERTTLEIRFDNAAPTASLRSPQNGSFASGSTVRVSGVALPDWTVSAAGIALAKDAQHRFSGEVTVPAGQRGFSVLLVHPRRGTHYYLRRTSGVP